MMRPEDVDAALVEKAARALRDEQCTGHDHGTDACPDRHCRDDRTLPFYRARVRPALAAVLPEIQAQAKEEIERLERRLADLTARIGFGDGVTEPQADNDTIVKAVNEAFTNSNALWEIEEQVERVRALADHYKARHGTGLGRVSTGNVAASIRRALGVQAATTERPTT